jgi:hypothetical protein
MSLVIQDAILFEKDTKVQRSNNILLLLLRSRMKKNKYRLITFINCLLFILINKSFGAKQKSYLLLIVFLIQVVVLGKVNTFQDELNGCFFHPFDTHLVCQFCQPFQCQQSHLYFTTLPPLWCHISN